MKAEQHHRRRLLKVGAIACATALTGCGQPSTTFNTIDITGSGYGSSLNRLVDRSGRTGQLRRFEGQVVAVFFGFTSCPDVCPTSLAKLHEVKKLLGTEGSRFVAVFITIDPERDALSTIDAYVRAFDPSFVALRGDPASTRYVADDFKAFYETVPMAPGGYSMNHTTGIFIFDTKGRSRLFARHDDGPPLIVDDVRKLLRERG